MSIDKGWIDITDKRKPKNREFVLVYVPGFCSSEFAIADYDVMTKSFEEEQYGMITSWVKKWSRFKKPKNDKLE